MKTSDAPIICQRFVIDRKEELFKVARRILATEFKMKELDMIHYFICMEVWHNVDGISFGQGKYAVEIMKRFKMMDCKAMTTPMA